MTAKKLKFTYMKKIFLIYCLLGTFFLWSQENAPNPSDNKNWISNISYDLNGNTISKGIGYFNTLGKPTQSQSWDVLTNKVWTSQTMYDYQGRPALQTLSAPTGTAFGYQNSFVQKTNGNFTVADFDTPATLSSPATIGSQPNSLGWYYSNNNTSEPYQDITAYPFSRSIYSRLNPGTVLKNIGGNKVTINGTDQWLQGHSFSMPVAQELQYAFGLDQYPKIKVFESECTFPMQTFYTEYMYDIQLVNIENCTYGPTIFNVLINGGTTEFLLNNIYKVDAFLDFANNIYNEQEAYYKIVGRTPGLDYNATKNANIQCGPFMSCSQVYIQADYIKASKTVMRDVRGIETVVFTDSDGNTLAAARSGNEDGKAPSPYNVVSPIGEQGFVDIHIPVGCGGTISFVGASATYYIYDLVTEAKLNGGNPISTRTFPLTPGIYRIQEATTAFHKNPFPYVKINNGAISLIDNNLNIGVSYSVNYYDYSLNFYDKAGRLTQSVQPEGFDAALSLTVPTRNHSLTSSFTYNTLGQLLNTSNPDEGTAQFKYRKDGQIRFSQNSLQATNNEFSYTNYDTLGRPTDSGVLQSTDFATADPDNNTLPSGTAKEQTFTVYDMPDSGLAQLLTSAGLPSNNYKQQFVAGNVSKTYTSNPSTTTTWYSYDNYGRLTWLVQNINGLGIKTIDYEYDFAKGHVTKVLYQKNSPSDVFVHRYNYDNAGQLTSVETSTNNTAFTQQESYTYFETGGLKRKVLLGGIQGTDYVYNLSGQLKAINHPGLSPDKDPGGDTNDAFGMLIDYHEKDYARTQRTNISTSPFGTNQYNGNIKTIRWNTFGNALPAQRENTYNYQYNKNNWLQEANYGESITNNSTETLAENLTSVAVTANGSTLDLKATSTIVMLPGFHAQSGSTVTTKISPLTSFNPKNNGDYNEGNITYDANGNIQTLKRNKNTVAGSNAMDELTYNYDPAKPNQLSSVDDAVTIPTNAQDIKDQNANNYKYNSIGQLTENVSEGIKYVYNASGLVTVVLKNSLPLVKFFYSDKGYRVKKETYNNPGNLTSTDYYVSDAAGNIMAIYRGTSLTEQAIYGAGRIGVYKRPSNSSVYELTDHLGNVRAVIGKDSNNNMLMLSRTDYYPFGMPMPDRNIVGDYRYAFQGQEKDTETGMEAFQLRLWDGRLGRWLTVDPYGQFDSPYVGMGNNPIDGIDSDGGCYVKNSDGSYSPCPDGKLGAQRNDSFGFNWTFTKDSGWQLTHGASGKIVTSYVPVLADGSANYYIKRYLDHLQRYNSKPPDYYLSYGHKYINRFKNETNSKLSKAGQIWLKATASSLQRLMETGLKNSKGSIAMNNDAFQNFAFKTHVPAYVGSGLLDLSNSDKFTIGNTPDYKDLFTSNGFEQVRIIFALQELKWMFQTLNYIGEQAKGKPDCGCPK